MTPDETVSEFLRRVTSGDLDEVEWTVHRQAATGRVVINERTDTFRAQGAQMSIPVCGVFELTADGKISLWRDYFDMAVVNEGVAALTAATADD